MRALAVVIVVVALCASAARAESPEAAPDRPVAATVVTAIGAGAGAFAGYYGMSLVFDARRAREIDANTQLLSLALAPLGAAAGAFLVSWPFVGLADAGLAAGVAALGAAVGLVVGALAAVFVLFVGAPYAGQPEVVRGFERVAWWTVATPVVLGSAAGAGAVVWERDLE